MKMTSYKPADFDRDGNLAWPFPSVPRKIYIAASMNNLQKALIWTIKLTKAGFEVVSRWPHEHWPDASIMGKPRLAAEWATHNTADLDSADTLVLFSNEPSTSGGYHFELGYATAKGKNVVVVGPRLSVFFYCDEVRILRNESDLVEFLGNSEHGQGIEIQGDYIEVV